METKYKATFDRIEGDRTIVESIMIVNLTLMVDPKILRNIVHCVLSRTIMSIIDMLCWKHSPDI